MACRNTGSSSTMNAYSVVDQFERRVADFAGAKYGVAVESCTAALFLSMYYLRHYAKNRPVAKWVKCPIRTYLSVPMAIHHAGWDAAFSDIEWTGAYRLDPLPVTDAAKRFRRGMYDGGFYCLSFHTKKSIAIGRGGMILIDDEDAYACLKKLRYDGRSGKPYAEENVDVMGWNMYMLPEQAARGLMLMDAMPSPDGFPDQIEGYPDLTKHAAFRNLVIQ